MCSFNTGSSSKPITCICTGSGEERRAGEAGQRDWHRRFNGRGGGPHLHYEFLVNGVHRNPRTVHKILPKARSLPGRTAPVPRLDSAARSAASQPPQLTASGPCRVTQPYFIGLMSGTSADGIDAVLITTEGNQSELLGSIIARCRRHFGTKF